MKNNTNPIQIHLSIFEWTGLQTLPDNSCSIMCYFYYTQDLAAAENVCLGQSSKNLLALQDTQAKLQYGEILKILHFACNYSLITEGAEWSFRFSNRLEAIASSVQIVKQHLSWCPAAKRMFQQLCYQESLTSLLQLYTGSIIWKQTYSFPNNLSIHPFLEEPEK